MVLLAVILLFGFTVSVAETVSTTVEGGAVDVVVLAIVSVSVVIASVVVLMNVVELEVVVGVVVSVSA